MTFTPIGDTLKEKALTGKAKQQVDASHILELASAVFVDLFGKELAAHANPLYLKNRTLTVTCTSAALAQEIRLNQQRIVDTLNSQMGESLVDRIRYLS